MLQNYFKLAWRNIIKERRSAFLNLTGLSTGLACTILIYLWISDELKVDKWNEKDSQLYQVMHSIKTPDGIETIENTPGLLADALAKEMPEVTYATAVIPSGWFSKKGLISFGDAHLRASSQFVSKDYFNVFSCDFLHGNKAQLFSGKNTIALSDKLALKLFRTLDIVGRTIEWNDEAFSGNYLITGVFKSLPSNATVQFDALFNYDLFLDKNPKLQNWGNSDPSTYIILKKGTPIDQFNSKIEDFIRTKNKKSTAGLFAQRFSDRYLYNHYENGAMAGGRIQYIKLFSIIAVFVLLIACINFMNLSTSKALRRIKEIGVQKIMGADRRLLILQYLSESLVMAFLSLFVAIGFVVILFPFFKEITGKELSFSVTPAEAFFILLVTLITGVVAGSYPALYLSRFKPVQALKGGLKNTGGQLWVRRGLVVFQFVISVVLIISVLVVYRQMNYVQTIHLGYNKDHVIYFEKGGRLPDTKDYFKGGAAYESELQTFLQRIKNIPGVVNASNFRHNITNRHGGTTGVTWPGKSTDDGTAFTDIAAGYNFIETLGIEMKEGDTYSAKPGSEKSKVIFNEAAINSMGLKDPVGKIVNIWGEDKEIIGVTKNFHFESLYQDIQPCFLDFSVTPRASKIMVRLKAGEERAAIERIAAFYKEYNSEPLDFKFLDDDYQALYQSEQRVAVLSRYFAGIAILISCLGLFGLTAYTAQKRQKEIGIRKVVGATALNLVSMLSFDLLKLVFLSLLIAMPLSWWFCYQWLQSFAYRVTISYETFIVTAVLIFLISLFTISFQTIKAAFANPVKSLHAE